MLKFQVVLKHTKKFYANLSGVYAGSLQSSDKIKYTNDKLNPSLS